MRSALWPFLLVPFLVGDLTGNQWVSCPNHRIRILSSRCGYPPISINGGKLGPEAKQTPPDPRTPGAGRDPGHFPALWRYASVERRRHWTPYPDLIYGLKSLLL